MERDLGAEELRRYFAGRLPHRLGELEDACRQAREAGWRGTPLRTFHRLAHSLAGAGAIFGFPAVSDVARRLERHLKPVLENGAPASEGEIASLLAELRQTIGA